MDHALICSLFLVLGGDPVLDQPASPAPEPRCFALDLVAAPRPERLFAYVGAGAPPSTLQVVVGSGLLERRATETSCTGSCDDRCYVNGAAFSVKGLALNGNRFTVGFEGRRADLTGLRLLAATRPVSAPFRNVTGKARDRLLATLTTANGGAVQCVLPGCELFEWGKLVRMEHDDHSRQRVSTYFWEHRGIQRGESTGVGWSGSGVMAVFDVNGSPAVLVESCTDGSGCTRALLVDREGKTMAVDCGRDSYVECSH